VPTNGREAWGSILGLLSGLAIAFVDSRPTWDDTGITAAALVGSAVLATIVAGRRPWLVALLVGLPTPLLEMPERGPVAFIAVVIAAIGALGGFLAERMGQADLPARD
jgi:hypothetical protein